LNLLNPTIPARIIIPPIIVAGVSFSSRKTIPAIAAIKGIRNIKFTISLVVSASERDFVQKSEARTLAINDKQKIMKKLSKFILGISSNDFGEYNTISIVPAKRLKVVASEAEYLSTNFFCIILYIAKAVDAKSIQNTPALNERTPSHSVSTRIPVKEIKIEIQQ